MPTIHIFPHTRHATDANRDKFAQAFPDGTESSIASMNGWNCTARVHHATLIAHTSAELAHAAARADAGIAPAPKLTVPTSPPTPPTVREALRAIVNKSYLSASQEDCHVHPDLIADARRALECSPHDAMIQSLQRMLDATQADCAHLAARMAENQKLPTAEERNADGFAGLYSGLMHCRTRVDKLREAITALKALDVKPEAITYKPAPHAAPLTIRAALEEITPAYEELLREYGKPFGWGTMTSDNARAALAADPQP